MNSVRPLMKAILSTLKRKLGMSCSYLLIYADAII